MLASASVRPDPEGEHGHREHARRTARLVTIAVVTAVLSIAIPVLLARAHAGDSAPAHSDGAVDAGQQSNWMPALRPLVDPTGLSATWTHRGPQGALHPAVAQLVVGDPGSDRGGASVRVAGS